MTKPPFSRKSAMFWISTGMLIALLTAWVASRIAIQQGNAYLDAKVSEEADQLIEKMYQRIALYQHGLRSARGFILVQELNNTLHRSSFIHYPDIMDYATELPGARGFGFIRRIPVAQEADFINQARHDDFPDFTIRQLSPHDDERYIIQYIEPLAHNRAAVGLDIASETDRRTAAQQAITTGTTQLTAPITLVQATGNPQQSFLILMPIYKTWTTPSSLTERWEAAIGWSYAPLLMTEILDSLNVDPALYKMRLTDIKDQGQEQIFYELNQSQQYGAKQIRTKDVFGRVWQLELSATPELVAQLHLIKPSTMFMMTFFVSAIILSLLYALINYWRTRNQLFKQMSQLAAIVESSQDAIIGKDLNGNILSWNKGATTIFGYNESDAIGQSVLELLVPEGLETEELNIQKNVRQGQGKINLVTQRKRQNGECFDALINVTPIFDDKQRVVGASKTVRDISQLKAAENQLKELNANLEQQVQQRTAELSQSLRENTAILKVINAQFLFSITDKRGNIIEVNQNFCDATGYSAAELQGQNHRILNSKWHPRQFWTDMWHTVLQGDSWRAEICNVTRNGETHWFDTVITPILDESAKVERILSIRIDITARKQMEMALAAARDQLDKAAEVAELGIWTWQLDNNRLIWNERMFSIYQQPIELQETGVLYDHWRERIYSEDRAQTEQLMQQALDGSAKFDTIFRIQLPSGELRYIKAAAQIEYNQKGKPEKVTGINYDVTAQQLLEEELRRAKALADEASESKSQFLANMSHEIRTPMNAVLGMLALVKRTKLDRQQVGYIENADRSAKSLLGILNDILDYSKIAAGKMVLDPVEFSLEDALRELGIILAGNHKNKSVEIILDKDTNLPDILIGDRLRFLQILINLGGNALKFTEQGHVLIRLFPLAIEPHYVQMRVQVEDTGIGITPEQQKHIFLDFSQAEASTTRRFGGTGLGLFICKRLLELMGSELQLDSQPNMGSTFSFDLQFNYKTDTLRAETTAQATTIHKILVVDDNPLLADILAEGLTQSGWIASKALSAADALTQLDSAHQQGEPFEGVIMDWNMPDMDGLTACQKIREHSDMATPFIVMFTAYEKQFINQLAGTAQKPFDQMLIKPVTVAQIEEILLEQFNPSHQQSGTQHPDPTIQNNPQPLAGLHLLVVEDNEINRIVASELLTQAGALVSIANCGLAGVDKVVSDTPDRYDVVLMDIQMPDIDGYEATQRIRAHVDFKNLPIIAMTANASDKDRAACLAAGMNEHIAKPFEMDKLVALITRFCSPERQPAESPSAQHDNTTNDMLTESSGQILQRFNNNEDLATRMIARFAKEASTLHERLETAIAANDPIDFTTAAHSLKGMAATLGAVRLSELAAQLEAKGRQEQFASRDTMSQLSKLIQQSDTALQQLDFAQPTASKRQANRLPQDELKATIAQLEDDLNNSNMNAIALAQALLTIDSNDQAVKNLHQQIEDLDFEQALTTLQTLKARWLHDDT